MGTRPEPVPVSQSGECFIFASISGVKYLPDEKRRRRRRRRDGMAARGVEFDTRHITLLLRTRHLARKQNLERRDGRREGRSSLLCEIPDD